MSLKIAKGSYVGDGLTSGVRAITGAGFEPKVIFVVSDKASTSGYNGTNFYTKTLSDDGAKALLTFGENGIASSTTFDVFDSIDADGFSIRRGTNTAQHFLNENSINYYWVALGGDDVSIGSYVGNNTDNRDITGIGFKPDFVLVEGGNQHSLIKFTSAGDATDISSYTYNGADVSNGIQQLLSDGFQVGTAVQVNASSTTYYYIAIKGSVDGFYQSQYIGNGADNRDITGVGFEPEVVFIKAATALGWAWRTDQFTGDSSKEYRISAFPTNRIQGFNSDGFQVGSQNVVNSSGVTFRYFAMKDNDAGGGGGASPQSSNLLMMGV